MKLKRNRYWISGVTLVVALQVMVLSPVDAFVLSLGEGLPQDPGVMRSSGAEVLYATDRDGQEVKLAGTDAPLGDGTPLDLGRPSVGPDGTVLFAAGFRPLTRFAGKCSLPTRTPTPTRSTSRSVASAVATPLRRTISRTA